jgi:tetratricopeptide (TPR) repeat protein
MEAWERLVQLTSQMEDFDEVIRICEKCQGIFPESVDFHFYQGIAYYRKKAFQAAVDTYLEAIQLIPSDNIALSNFYGQMGDTYFRMKETDKAFNAYEEALKYNDKNILVLNNYAYYLSLLKKDISKAERMSALTVKMEPNSSTYLDTYAWIFFIQGNFMLAKIYIESAISKDRTGSAELADHYGDILYKSGDREKAVEQWKKAKELGKKTATVDKKIAEESYFEATNDELFSEIDDDSITYNTEQ